MLSRNGGSPMYPTSKSGPHVRFVLDHHVCLGGSLELKSCILHAPRQDDGNTKKRGGSMFLDVVPDRIPPPFRCCTTAPTTALSKVPTGEGLVQVLTPHKPSRDLHRNTLEGLVKCCFVCSSFGARFLCPVNRNAYFLESRAV